ncbi:MAG: hypothetical protein K2M39_07160, partial [Muribaculaceae bacterium]|nr:hypothetical protein [Muribaculaceae bacterium]
RGGTELFLFPIRVISAEERMPWHGDLRAETGYFFDRRTGEQAFLDKRTEGSTVLLSYCSPV